MGVPIQSADFVTRLRRAFGLRGVISPDVEETILPVAVVGRLDESPYGTEGAVVVVGANAGAVAGQLAAVEITFNESVLSKSVAVLDHVIISTAGGGSSLVNWGLRLGLLGASQRGFHSQYDPRGPNLSDIFQPTPLEAAGANRVASGITQMLATSINVQSVSTTFPLGGFLLRPTSTFIFECVSVNIPLQAAVVARVYTNLG